MHTNAGQKGARPGHDHLDFLDHPGLVVGADQEVLDARDGLFDRFLVESVVVGSVRRVLLRLTFFLQVVPC